MTERTYTTHDDISAAIAETCQKLDSSMIDKITFRFNGRMTSTLGRANYATGLLQFSRPLWVKATPDQRYQNIVHEVCHVVAYEKAGAHGTGHGIVWRRLMIQCGLNPHRCHKVEVAKRRQRGSLDVRCACPGKVHVLSTRAANRFRSGYANLKCRTCRSKVWVEAEVLRADIMKHGISPMAVQSMASRALRAEAAERSKS